MLSPLTGTDNIRKIREISPNVLADRWRSELNVEVGSRFEMLPTIKQWYCNTTGLEWYEPSECVGDGQLYEQLQRYDWYYMPDKWEFQVALNIFPKRSNILEVGVGYGNFMSAARGRGIQVSGIELNASAANVARIAGFMIYEKNIEELENELGPVFDGVCAFQVLEHIPEPLHFLQGALGMLRPGGRLVLSVPNAAVLRILDPENNGLLNQPPHHVTCWDETVFRSLEQLLPVKVGVVKTEPLQSYHVSWFVDSIAGQLRRRMGLFFGSLLVNKLSVLLATCLLQLGLRKLIPGHTLLVILEKNP
jgi:2-polyprenyl-3-methyl-5-hydroxy-6-metoxy-1,4-benzoquinol methylase